MWTSSLPLFLFPPRMWFFFPLYTSHFKWVINILFFSLLQSLSRTSSSLNKRAQVVIWRRARCQSVGVRRLQICLSGCFPLLLYYFDYLFLLELDATRHFIRLPSLFLTCLPLPLLFFIEQIIIWFRKHVALTPKSDRAVYVKMEWDDGSSRFLALIGLIYDVCQGGKKTLLFSCLFRWVKEQLSARLMQTLKESFSRKWLFLRLPWIES